tara:strand:+ start:227 stop:433 length:207 start_codon:yes stop_codon:yes gene_type:complete
VFVFYGTRLQRQDAVPPFQVLDVGADVRNEFVARKFVFGNPLLLDHFFRHLLHPMYFIGLQQFYQFYS